MKTVQRNSTIILPKKAYHESSNVDDDDDDDDEGEFDLPVVKKKKRSVLTLRVVSTFTLILQNFYSQLGKNPIITEEGINKMAYAVETSIPKTIRRFVM